MVRVVRVPKFAIHVFSHNELSGWVDGIAYQPGRNKRRRQRKQPTTEEEQMFFPTDITKKVTGGQELKL